MSLPNLARISETATPGPWSDPKWGGIIVDSNENPVAHHVSPKDAALIAAAPAMAALLIECEQALDQVVKQYEIDWCYRQGEMAWGLLARLADFDKGIG